MNPHGGQESTILALNNVFYQWGAIIVAVGYTDPSIYAAGGNPLHALPARSPDTHSHPDDNRYFYCQYGPAGARY